MAAAVKAGGFQGGGGHGGHGGGSHGSDHAGDHSRDGDHRHDGAYHHNADQFDRDHPQDQDIIRFGGERFPAVETEDGLGLRDGYYEDHRLEGIYASWASWWPASLFHRHPYGSGYRPPCVRRDVYNDIYQAC